MNHCTTYVGLDAHKKAINVSMLVDGQRQALEWQVANTPRSVARMVRKVQQQATGEVVMCYEAGPLGYSLQRELQARGVTCHVVAPSLIPVKPGERIKTDRRDARKLAELLRAGLLTMVHTPTPEQEAVRDLCRCREDAREDLTRARHRMMKFLLRRGITFTAGKKLWTKAHRQWLRGLRLELATDQSTFDAYLLAIDHAEQRLQVLVEQLEVISQHEPYAAPVGWLRCFRGIDTVSAMSILAEIGDFRRFPTARHLMSYLGLTPSEHSSSTRIRRGSITKAGNGHVRRILVEASWHARHRPAVGVKLARRRRGQPTWAIAIADQAQQRLWRRFTRLRDHNGKPANAAVVAVARELAGFIWAMMHEGDHREQLEMS